MSLKVIRSAGIAFLFGLVVGLGLLIEDGAGTTYAANRTAASADNRTEPAEEDSGYEWDFAGIPTYDPYPDGFEVTACVDAASRHRSPSFARSLLLGVNGPKSLSRTLGDTAALIERVRGLRFESPPRAVFHKPKSIARLNVKAFRRWQQRHYSESEFLAWEQTLKALGAVDYFADLRSLSVYYTGEDILGFYRPGSGIIYSPVDQKGAVRGWKRMTLAHELGHAVVDQRLPHLWQRLNSDDSEKQAAVRALIEGDATLTEFAVDAAIHLAPRYRLRAEPQEETAYTLLRESDFPYTDGFGFVCDLFLAGGWPAVDAAYRDPPSTTAEILYPERYIRGQVPVDPRNPGAPGGSFERVDHRTFGAAELFPLFEAPGDDPTKAIGELDEIGRLVSEWSGGELTLYTSPFDDVALGLALETRHSDSPLCAAVGRWYGAAFETYERVETAGGGERFAYEGSLFGGHPRAAIVWCEDREVRLGIGPDLASARAIAE